MDKRLTRQYDVKFKLSAVELVEQQSYSVPVAAESLGVSKSNLYTWWSWFTPLDSRSIT